MPTTAPGAAAAPHADRLLAPDLARGLMLALIAVANVMIFLHDRPYGLRQHVITDSILDRVTSSAVVLLVDARAYPLFAALFGYGLVLMVRRRRERGADEAQIRRVVRRRSLGLLLFGGVHALLAFSGDILGWYGLLGLLTMVLLRLGDRALLGAALAWLVIASAVQGLVFADAGPHTQRTYLWSYAIDEPLGATAWRLAEWLMNPFGLLAVLSAMMVGLWAGRYRLLEHPGRHRTLLRRTAVVGIAAGLAGGAGPALVTAQLWTPGPAALAALSALHVLTGVLCGLGYAALIALLAERMTSGGRRPGPLARALQATGQRSLSAYLAQSVVFAVLLPASTLGLGATVGPAAALALALATWAATVALAAARPGRPGPAEELLRRFVRGSARRPDAATIGR